MKGKIVAIPFPFADLKGAKVRPALVIYEGMRMSLWHLSLQKYLMSHTMSMSS